MNILGYDFGLYLSHYLHLAEEGNSIRYYTPWQSGFPKFENFAIGAGFNRIKKVLYFFEHVKWADMITCFDVGTGDLVSHLREHGYVVLGNGREGEDLEQNRWKLKQLMKQLGLPVQHTARIQGTNGLRDYLKKNPHKFVKVDIFRGSEGMESFKAESLEDVELRIDRIETDLGPYKDIYQFIVEDEIEDAVEPGWDLWFNGNEFVKPYLYAWEFQKASYLGKFVEEMPKPLQTVADKLAPYLRSIDYRGPISTEVRVTKDGTPYLIDICSRLPAPCSAVYSIAIKNYTELLYNVATKRKVRIEPTAQYVSIYPFETETAKKNWVKLNFDSGDKTVALQHTSKVNGSYYAVPGSETVLVLCAVGNTISEVKSKLEKNSEGLDADGLNKNMSLDNLWKELDKASDYGLSI